MIRLDAHITRVAPRLGFCYTVARDKKAREESYVFQMISPGFYLCVTATGKAYAISETQKSVGCACEDMTYRLKENDVCKHLIAFARLPDVPMAPLSPVYEQLLRAAGWTGERLHPPEPKQEKKKLPPIHDPARQESSKAPARAAARTNGSRSTDEIMAEMPLQKVKQNARRGASAAIAELEKRGEPPVAISWTGR